MSAAQDERVPSLEEAAEAIRALKGVSPAALERASAELEADHQAEEDDWAVGTLRMFLNLCADSTGDAVDEAWGHDFDSMACCLSGARAFLDTRLRPALAENARLLAQLSGIKKALLPWLQKYRERIGSAAAQELADALKAAQCAASRHPAEPEAGAHG